jgi:hypothetical protein
MNRDDIIRMAREACGEPAWSGGVEWTWEELERFAALVYVEGHKDGLDDFEAGVLPAAIKAEREACAKVCMDKWMEWMDASPDKRLDMRNDAEDCAFAIRERGAPALERLNKAAEDNGEPL